MEDKVIFQVPGSITAIKTMSHYLRLNVDTQENLSPEAYKRLFELHNQVGWFTMMVSQIQVEDVKNLTPLSAPAKNSPSKQLRDILYALWCKDNKGMADFESYYQWYYDYLIASAKNELG